MAKEVVYTEEEVAAMILAERKRCANICKARAYLYCEQPEGRREGSRNHGKAIAANTCASLIEQG